MKFKDTIYGDLTDKIFVGSINVSGIGLTSLEGSPKIIINGNFDCSYNKLTSLVDSPEIIRGHFNCSSNKLSTLEYSPQEIDGSYMCYDNQLVSLKGSPIEIKSGFFCGMNKLTSLEHAPKIVKGNFNTCSNQLTTTKYAPNEIGGKSFWRDNPNPYLEEEYKAKQENPDLSENEFNQLMYEITECADYLPAKLQEMFIF